MVCLVHSPLVGPGTWVPAAARLRDRGYDAIVPELPAGVEGAPFWQQHAAAVASVLAARV